MKFLKDNKIGRKDSYYGGYTIWVSHFGQSLARKNHMQEHSQMFLQQMGSKHMQ